MLLGDTVRALALCSVALTISSDLWFVNRLGASCKWFPCLLSLRHKQVISDYALGNIFNPEEPGFVY